MNKYLKAIIVIVIVALVFVFALLVSGRKAVKEISYDEYSEIVSDGGFVYYGSKDEMEALKEVAKEADITIGLLSSTESKTEKLKEGTLYEYKDGKVVYSYTGEIDSYRLTSSLMKERIMDRDYIPVTLDEYKKIIKEKGYHFMFIGSEQCGYCQQFKTSIEESLEDYDYNIYYLDISTLSETEYNDLVATDSYMSENEWGTPLNLLYKDGKRIAELNGYVATDELVKFLKENKVI